MARTILVIDDEPDVLNIVRATLITRGHNVLTALSGQEGLDLAQQEAPDLIICDLMMPRMSGLEVLKRLKKNEHLALIPILVISALGDESRPPSFWITSLGVDDYLMKPFDPLDLLGRVEYILRRENYVTRRPAPPGTPRDASAGEDPGGSETLFPADLHESTPAQIVTAFIEAWNKQEFTTEYNCLGVEMLAGMGLRDYVARRRACYLDEKGHSRTQKVLRVIEEKISVNIAKVIVDRQDGVDRQTRERREVYSLKKTNKGWKIISCRTAKAE